MRSLNSKEAAAAFALGALIHLAPFAALAQFESDKITLLSNITPVQFGASGSNDCWGYVSKSGREYALMGLNDRLGVVEITDPKNPVIVATVSHATSNRSDIKVYHDHAYVANGNGGGIDIIDLRNVDDGVVKLVQRFTGGGVQRSHNIAINEDSGFLYLCIGNINSGAIVAYDLSDPQNPLEAGRYSGARSHDLQLVSYTSGKYAGREIAFSPSEGRGLDIIDVTDKKNMFFLSRTTYDGLGYCHQGWISADKRYFYFGDERDELDRGFKTRTLVLDIADLEEPVLVNTFTTGRNSIDHDQYLKNGFLYQANNTSGLWIYDVRDNPTNPTVVGFFDTYPDGDPVISAGAWSVFPWYPSGNVIVGDRNRGLFVLDPSEAVGGDCDPCDTNCDGSVDLKDIEFFINCLLGCEACSPCVGDANGDGSVDLTDVEAFIECLLG